MQVATSLPSLVSLNVSHCPYISDASLELLGTHVKGLMELDVSFCVAITSQGVYARACIVPTGLPADTCSLVRVELFHATYSRSSTTCVCVVVCTGLRTMAKVGTPTLEKLSLAGCGRVDGTGVNAVSTHYTRLEHLDLSFLHKVRMYAASCTRAQRTVRDGVVCLCAEDSRNA